MKDEKKRRNDYSPWTEICKRIEAERYALRNRTQKLIMSEISRYDDLFFSTVGKYMREKHWPQYFKIKHYLFKKYKIY